jgi:hypothetical protein
VRQATANSEWSKSLRQSRVPVKPRKVSFKKKVIELKESELKDEYRLEDLPSPFWTNIDLYEESEDAIAEFMRELCKPNIVPVLYTQVDGEKDRLYSKGDCFVNRTGVYAVVLVEK